MQGLLEQISEAYVHNAVAAVLMFSSYTRMFMAHTLFDAQKINAALCFHGEAATGKTSLITLASTVFGVTPDFDGSLPSTSYNCVTRQKVMQHMSGLCGVPIFLNDVRLEKIQVG